MPSNVEVPSLGESITEAVLLQWLKDEGEQVAVDEPICELESDKATVDLPAPASGVLHRIKDAGQTARVGEVIAQIEPAKAAKPSPKPSPPAAAGKEEQAGQAPVPTPAKETKEERAEPVPETTTREAWKVSAPTAVPAPVESAKVPRPPAKKQPTAEAPARGEQGDSRGPAPAQVPGAGRVERPHEQASSTGAQAAESEAPPDSIVKADGVRRVTMSRIRQRIAERLVRAQQTAAMLTTFNEIDMSAVQELRARHGERFKEMHGVSLGLMSFFARACVLALKQFPMLNAMVESNDILYHEHVHLGIAVSTDRGLVVPVLRNAESLSFAQIEGEIKRAAAKAREGKLSIQDLSGGTFTITNGGVFGSLLSTPILNPPQTGILGMHTIQERPVVIEGRIEARPMMYVALTYDHRLVDGREAVSFLVKVKQLLEEPMQMILEI